MDKTELKQNYIRFHKTADGKHKGVSLEFANEIEMDSFLDEYAQQVSREVATQFLVDYAEHYVQNFHSLEKAQTYYDKWIKNHHHV